VERIFRYSNLKERISLALGPNFFPRIACECVSKMADQVDDPGYTVYKKTLQVKYFPFGVSQHQMKVLLDVAKSEAERTAEGKVAKYAEGEYGLGFAQLAISQRERCFLAGKCSISHTLPCEHE
jgi:hypothetical protein